MHVDNSRVGFVEQKRNSDNIYGFCDLTQIAVVHFIIRYAHTNRSMNALADLSLKLII